MIPCNKEGMGQWFGVCPFFTHFAFLACAFLTLATPSFCLKRASGDLAKSTVLLENFDIVVETAKTDLKSHDSSCSRSPDQAEFKVFSVSVF